MFLRIEFRDKQKFLKNKINFRFGQTGQGILKLILKTQIQDNLGGYFCISRKSLNKLPNNKIFYGYGEYFFRLLFYAIKKKLTILEIPAVYKRRNRGKSKSKFIYMFYKYFIEALKLRLN